MAAPLPRQLPTAVPTTRGTALSGASTGIKLSYTVPAGRTAKLLSATMFLTNLAPTVALQIVSAATTFNLTSAAANFTYGLQQWLQAGDVVQLNVTSLIGASTFDGTIAVEEYESQ